jgi:RNA polymerase-binding transcription factor DksA
MLDLFFLSTIWLLVCYLVIDYYAYTNSFIIKNQTYLTLVTSVFGILILLKLKTMQWKWSVYRVLDIFTIYLLFIFAYLFLRDILERNEPKRVVFLLLFFFIYLLTYLYKNKLFSGLVFSVFLLLLSIFGQLFYTSKPYLIFYFILITISMVNLFFRTRRNMMAKKLGQDFLDKIKELLRLKDKRLQLEQQKLLEDDPYLQEGRDTDNAEEMDEAILEDRAKIEHDIKKENIEDMKKQVDKALDKMEKGEYGICEVCGKPIDKARLEVYPEATTCVDHA